MPQHCLAARLRSGAEQRDPHPDAHCGVLSATLTDMLYLTMLSSCCRMCGCAMEWTGSQWHTDLRSGQVQHQQMTGQLLWWTPLAERLLPSLGHLASPPCMLFLGHNRAAVSAMAVGQLPDVLMPGLWMHWLTSCSLQKRWSQACWGLCWLWP